MTMPMGVKLVRNIGLERAEACSGLKNLAFSFFRYLQRTSNAAIVASNLRRIAQPVCRYLQDLISALWRCRLRGRLFRVYGYCMELKMFEVPSTTNLDCYSFTVFKLPSGHSRHLSTQ